MDTGLYIVATPIGNLGDITIRALDTLREVDIIIAEDTRHSRKLLNHYEINTPMMSCHKFNEAYRCEQILDRLAQGQAIAMISDAGMPCISDPGSRVVHACRDAGFFVTVLPGACAAVSAFALSGFASPRFYFEGFLPHKSGKRARRLTELSALDCPFILYESPYRLLKVLGELQQHVSPDCLVSVNRELTKKFEEVQNGTPEEIIAGFGTRTIKGELVVIVDATACEKPTIP